MTTAKIKIPPKLIPVFVDKPGEVVRYRGAYGGRGSGKTRTFALMTAIRGYQMGMEGREGIILCTREYMNSLDESSLEEIKGAIRSHDWLNAYYEVGEKQIKSRDGRIAYAFSGLRHNVDSLKSKSRILLNWTDEAENVRETSYSKLIPTVREDNSEIWVTWNPESKDSPTHMRFRADPPPHSKIVEINWRDNPWFPEVLEIERQNDLAKRPETYEWIWEGAFNYILEGAYFGREMRQARKDGRLCEVPIDWSQPVHTAWDLGKAENNPIWCFQVIPIHDEDGNFIRNQPRIVDFYQPETEDLVDWCKWLDARGYTGNDYVPHDVITTEWGSGRTRIEKLRLAGRKPRRIPMVSVADGLQAGRDTINAAVFDAERCARGIEGLEAYRREWDEDRKTWKPTPLKDWAEHIGSAFRYLGLAWRDATPRVKEPEKPEELEYLVGPTGVIQGNMTVKEAVDAMVRRRRGEDG